MSSVAELNRRVARVILETLTKHGVENIVIAPGSRSTPLTLEAAANSKLICHTHFDERGLGHMALGIAKVTDKPVGVIVTSGTAVANLLPAVIEAKYSGEKIILLTADRPPELHDCGANQAIPQTNMFQGYATQTIALPRPTSDIPARWWVSILDDALNHLTHGALHINCPFAEPLYGAMGEEYAAWELSISGGYQASSRWLKRGCETITYQEPDWKEWRRKKGIVVAGSMKPHEGIAVSEWAKKQGWLLLSDVLSHTGQPAPHVNLWLQHERARQVLNEAEIVICFGKNLTGKALLSILARANPKEYWVVDSIEGRLDSAHHRGRRIVAPIDRWLTQHPPSEIHHIWREYCHSVTAPLIEKAKNAIKTLGGAEELTEARVATHLTALLPEEGQLFLGSSLILRLIDAIACLPKGYPIFANRGASGIDGLVSTAIGTAIGNGKPTLVVLGDLSALYDINALSLLPQVKAPIVFVVVNNNGGGIFSLLPTPKETRERFYQMPHHLNFNHAAALFHMKYEAPKGARELINAVSTAFKENRHALIEVIVPPDEGAYALNALIEKVSQT